MNTIHQNTLPPITKAYCDGFLEGYLTALLWLAPEDIILPKSGEFDHSSYLPRIPKAEVEKARVDCNTFIDCNYADLMGSAYVNLPEQAGHDFALTRRREGAGFWEADHCDEEQGKRLTANAQTYSEWVVFYKSHGWYYFE